MSAPAIEVRGLVKRYGGVTAVDGVDLSVAEGEIFGLLGPNGAGKTTVILTLLGLTEPSGGIVRVTGFDPARQPLEVKRRVGYMPDAVGFYDNLTARQNLRYTARLMGLDRDEAENRIDEALRRVRLADVAERKAGAFSRGMRQRLGLAEIIMKRAKVAILDEPTSALDPQSSAELLDMIRGLKHDGVTVLLSSHLLDRVQAVCDRVALFNRGRIALQGTVDELARQVLGGATIINLEVAGGDYRKTLADVPGIQRVMTEDGNRYRIMANRDVTSDVAAAVVANGGRVRRLGVEETSLDAIYTRYFREKADAA